MFSVRFYTFSKPENSTALPGSAAVEFSCTAKTPFSVLSPNITIIQNGSGGAAEWNPSQYNYAYIPSLNRYYFVLNWTNSGPTWEATLRVDALASYRTTIGNFSTYVYRSSHEYDGLVKDSQYPCKADFYEYKKSIDTVASSGGSPFAVQNSDLSNWVLVTVLGDNTQHLLMSYLHFLQFIIALFEDNYYEAVLGEFGATEYPEAKVAINPLQYVATAKLVRGLRNTFTGLNNTPMTTVAVGPASVTPGGNWECYACTSPTNAPLSYSFTRTNHPQAQTRGAWLNTDPTTASYELYVAPFGILQLPAQDIGLYDSIGLYWVVDPWNCNVTMTVTAYNDGHKSETEHDILHVSTPIGVDLLYAGQLDMTPGMGRITADLLSYASQMSGTAGLLKGVSGEGSGGINAVMNAGANAQSATMELGAKFTSYLVPHASIGGVSGGSMSNSYYSSWFSARFMKLVDEDNNDLGRPLMAIRTISNIPGYIRCNPEGLSIAGYKEELETIMGFMESGFHYV